MKLLVLEIFKEEELYGTYSNATKKLWLIQNAISKRGFSQTCTKLRALDYNSDIFNYDFFLIIDILSNFLYYDIVGLALRVKKWVQSGRISLK